jgi:hypothetical protein
VCGGAKVSTVIDLLRLENVMTAIPMMKARIIDTIILDAGTVVRRNTAIIARIATSEAVNAGLELAISILTDGNCPSEETIVVVKA